nr:hypothetical protein [Enterococcus sp. 665A]
MANQFMNGCNQFTKPTMDELVLQDHLVRKIDANKHRFTKEMNYIEAKAFQDEL